MIKERKLVFDKYCGKCAYCGCDLVKGWHVDHLEPVERYQSRYDKELHKYVKDPGMTRPERHCIENMNPSCASCNIYKGMMDLEMFRKEIGLLVGRLNTTFTQYKIAKRYGLIVETENPVTFYFELFTKQN